MLISKGAVVQVGFAMVESGVLAPRVGAGLQLVVVAAAAAVMGRDSKVVGSCAFEGVVHVEGLVDVLRSVDWLT